MQCADALVEGFATSHKSKPTPQYLSMKACMLNVASARVCCWNGLHTAQLSKALVCLTYQQSRPILPSPQSTPPLLRLRRSPIQSPHAKTQARHTTQIDKTCCRPRWLPSDTPSRRVVNRPLLGVPLYDHTLKTLLLKRGKQTTRRIASTAQQHSNKQPEATHKTAILCS
jgi:hypothetical protein